jgi:hypothetical protein
MLSSVIKTTLLGLTVVAVSAMTNPASASEKRTPIDRSSIRETSARVSSYGQEIRIVRNRSADKTFASFHAEPQLIDSNALAYFEIKSFAKDGEISRWRCIATHDVAECLGRPVKIRYLPEDTKIELSFKLIPRVAQPQAMAVAQR